MKISHKRIPHRKKCCSRLRKAIDNLHYVWRKKFCNMTKFPAVTSFLKGITATYNRNKMTNIFT